MLSFECWKLRSTRFVREGLVELGSAEKLHELHGLLFFCIFVVVRSIYDAFEKVKFKMEQIMQTDF